METAEIFTTGICILTGLLTLKAVCVTVKYALSRRHKVVVFYGWPANSRKWMTLFYNRKTGAFSYEVDDLFAEDKPIKYRDSDFCMSQGSKATDHEISLAKQVLKKYNLL